MDVNASGTLGSQRDPLKMRVLFCSSGKIQIASGPTGPCLPLQPYLGQCIGFLGLRHEIPETGWLHITEVYWLKKSTIKAALGLALTGDPVACLPLLPAILCVPLLVDASLQCLPPSSRGVSLVSLSLCLFSSSKDNSHIR